jgi:hypothetical protein
LFLEVIHIDDLKFGLLDGVNEDTTEFFLRDAEDGRKVFTQGTCLALELRVECINNDTGDVECGRHGSRMLLRYWRLR